MKDMDPSQIVGSGKEYTLNLHGGKQRKVIVTDVETDYPEGKLIVSHEHRRHHHQMQSSIRGYVWLYL